MGLSCYLQHAGQKRVKSGLAIVKTTATFILKNCFDNKKPLQRYQLGKGLLKGFSKKQVINNRNQYQQLLTG